MATWHDTTPRPVWVLRHGVTPLPAWPGILLAWRRTDPDGHKPPRWQGLVAYSRGGTTALEVTWLYDTQLRPVTEQPPSCGA